LIHCEQGLGDTLQFIRYVKPIVSQGGKVVVAAQAALIPLLAESGLGGLIPREGPLAAFDVHAPLLSLPRILGTDADSVPHDVPYLAVSPERTARWQTELARHEGMKIGIACQGQKNFRGDRFRSIPVEHFARLGQIPSVRLVSLQTEPKLTEIAGGNVPCETIDFGDALDRSGAFLDSAAIIKCLDLVVTSDTAVAHLAGALGARVWVALSAAPDWRWMFGRDDSPWYPTMRLFRQRRAGDWQQVFEDIVRELSGMIERGES
jgi:ADP-heptose:LPS heptosyltransferase